MMKKENLRIEDLGSLVGGFIALQIASASLDSLNERKEEYENLSELKTKKIDIDKRLNIKRLIDGDGELI